MRTNIFAMPFAVVIGVSSLLNFNFINFLHLWFFSRLYSNSLIFLNLNKNCDLFTKNKPTLDQLKGNEFQISLI